VSSECGGARGPTGSSTGSSACKKALARGSALPTAHSPPRPQLSRSHSAHTTQRKRRGQGGRHREESSGGSHCQGLSFPGWSHAASRLLGLRSGVGGLRCSSSGYCRRLDLPFSPEPGLEAARASPVSAALRELLGLTAALRVPWGLASPFF